MRAFLGALQIILFGAGALTLVVLCIASIIGSVWWLRYRSTMHRWGGVHAWRKRERLKDRIQHGRVHIMFGLTFTIVQIPFLFVPQATAVPWRVVSLIIAVAIFAWGFLGCGWLRRSWAMQVVDDLADLAHRAMSALSLPDGARAKEGEMRAGEAFLVVRVAFDMFIAFAYFFVLLQDIVSAILPALESSSLPGAVLL